MPADDRAAVLDDGHLGRELVGRLRRPADPPREIAGMQERRPRCVAERAGEQILHRGEVVPAPPRTPTHRSVLAEQRGQPLAQRRPEIVARQRERDLRLQRVERVARVKAATIERIRVDRLGAGERRRSRR